MVYAVKTTKLVGEKEVAALMERKDHIRQLRKEHRHREAQEKLGKRGGGTLTSETRWGAHIIK